MRRGGAAIVSTPAAAADNGKAVLEPDGDHSETLANSHFQLFLQISFGSIPNTVYKNGDCIFLSGHPHTLTGALQEMILA